MSKATDPLKLPASIKAAAARLAKEEGAVETAATFFRRRAGDARPEDLRAILALAPDHAPDPGDELPPGL